MPVKEYCSTSVYYTSACISVEYGSLLTSHVAFKLNRLLSLGFEASGSARLAVETLLRWCMFAGLKYLLPGSAGSLARTNELLQQATSPQPPMGTSISSRMGPSMDAAPQSSKPQQLPGSRPWASKEYDQGMISMTDTDHLTRYSILTLALAD